MPNENLISGIAVVIDDQINQEGANIKRILKQLDEKKIPYIGFEELPSVEFIKHFEGVPFILLDWIFKDTEVFGDGRNEIVMPEGLEEELIKKNIEFLQQIKSTTFTAVFIFTNEDKDHIKEKLVENGLFNEDNEDSSNFIFIKNKNELYGEHDLFTEVENWIKNNPSIYTLYQWENNYNKAKNSMFWDFYGRSPNWPKVLLDNFEADGVNAARELGETITRNVYTRMPQVCFDEAVYRNFDATTVSCEDLKRVLEGERFVEKRYLKKEDKFTGDIFKKTEYNNGQNEEVYYLNIRAQCDIAREKNPELYCLKGKALNQEEVDSLQRENGEFIEKKNHAIIAYIDNGKIINFKFRKLEIFKWNSIKVARIGKLLPPYITRVQQLYSMYFQRQGLPRNPDVLLTPVVSRE